MPTDCIRCSAGGDENGDEPGSRGRRRPCHSPSARPILLCNRHRQRLPPNPEDHNRPDQCSTPQRGREPELEPIGGDGEQHTHRHGRPHRARRGPAGPAGHGPAAVQIGQIRPEPAHADEPILQPGAAASEQVGCHDQEDRGGQPRHHGTDSRQADTDDPGQCQRYALRRSRPFRAARPRRGTGGPRNGCRRDGTAWLGGLHDVVVIHGRIVTIHEGQTKSPTPGLRTLPSSRGWSRWVGRQCSAATGRPSLQWSALHPALLTPSAPGVPCPAIRRCDSPV
jgi:hypothetical protein